MAELLINNKDAYAIWGVKMGKGFLDVLGASSPMKEFIENKSQNIVLIFICFNLGSHPVGGLPDFIYSDLFVS